MDTVERWFFVAAATSIFVLIGLGLISFGLGLISY
jgi:hypothetical protein